MKRLAFYSHAALAYGAIFSVSPRLSGADQIVTGNLVVNGSATIAADAAIGGILDVEGDSLTVGSNSGNYGIGMFYLPSGAEGVRWRITRTSAWQWEVDSGGIISPAMRLDATNSLKLYSGGDVALTLNPAAHSLSLGEATLIATGTGLATNGSFSISGALTAPNYTASGGVFTGGTNGLMLNAGGGGNQNVTLNPTGGGSVVINGNVGLGTTTPAERLTIATGGILLDNQASLISNPELSVAVKITTSGSWARGYGVVDSATETKAMFGAIGEGGSLTYAYVGKSYNQPWITFLPSGNVGIGTTNPTAALQVGSHTRLKKGKWAPPLTPDSESQGERIVFYQGGGWKTAIGMDDRNGIWFQAHTPVGDAAFQWFTGSQANVPVERMRLTEPGNLGIGTTSPGAKLHVNGSARFDGPVRIAPQGDLEMGEFTAGPTQ